MIQGHSTAGARGDIGIVLPFMFLLFVFILMSGYKDIYGANHALQLILVQKFNNPALYPNDVFVQETAFAYASALWYLVAWLSRFIDLHVLLAGIYILSRVLLLIGAGWLAKSLFNESRIAPLAGMAFIAAIPDPLIGAGNPIKDYAEQTSLAVGLVLMGFASFLDRRPFLTAVLMGLAMSMNLMYAFFGLVYLGASWLLLPEYRNAWRLWLTAAPLLILAGLPGIWLALQSGTQPLNDLRPVWQVAELQFPHHFFPLLWHPLLQALTLGLMGLSWWLGRSSSVAVAEKRVHLQIWAIVGLGWYVLAWLTPYVLQSFTLLRLHPIRGHDLWLLAAGVFFAGAAAAWIMRHPAQSARSAALQFSVLTLAIVWHRFDVLKLASMAQLILWLVLSGLLGGGLWVLWRRRGWDNYPLRLAWLALLVAVGLLFGRGMLLHYKRVAETNNWLGIPTPLSKPFAEWAKRSTKPEDVFLIPVGFGEGWQDFRHLSQRNVFVQWKDGTSWPYAPWYAEDWLERMRLLGLMEIAQLREEDYRIGRWIHVRDTYAKELSRYVDEQRVLQIAQQFRIDYWITHKDTPTSLPVVYQSGEWKVVRVSPANNRRSGRP